MPTSITFGSAAARSLGFAGRGKKFVTETITASQTWVAPLTTNMLTVLVGKGADGTPSVYSGDVPRSMGVVSVLVDSDAGGVHRGQKSWSTFQTSASAAASSVNAGGSGSFTVTEYYGHLGDVTYDLVTSTHSFTNAIPGSATTSYSAGWQTSGYPSDGDDATASVMWNEYGTTTAATTGAGAGGFGKTFAGGVGGAASPATFNNLAVTPGASYPLTVPAGGSITISYYK